MDWRSLNLKYMENDWLWNETDECNKNLQPYKKQDTSHQQHHEHCHCNVHESELDVVWWLSVCVISKFNMFNATSIPKGSYSAKTGVNCPMSPYGDWAHKQTTRSMGLLLIVQCPCTLVSLILWFEPLVLMMHSFFTKSNMSKVSSQQNV